MFRLELPSARSVHLLHGLELRKIHSTWLTLSLPDVSGTHPVGIIQRKDQTMKKKSPSIKAKLSNGMEVEFRSNRVLGYTSQYQVRKFNSGVNSGIKLGDNVTIVPSPTAKKSPSPKAQTPTSTCTMRRGSSRSRYGQVYRVQRHEGTLVVSTASSVS